MQIGCKNLGGGPECERRGELRYSLSEKEMEA